MLTKNLGNWTWDIETYLVNYNPKKIKALGYTTEEIPQRVTYSFFTEKIYIEDYPVVRDAILSVIQGDSNSFDVSYRIRTKKGGFRWFRDKCEVTMRDDNGKPLTVAGITFDVTEDMLLVNKSNDDEKSSAPVSQIDSDAALIDYLTNTLNSAGMNARLADEIDAARIHTQFLTVALFEIDDFLTINTDEGHPFGDYVLIRTADILKDKMRETDVLGRYRVNQFMIIFSKTPKEIAMSISKTIQSDVADFEFGAGISISMQCGIVEYLGEDIETFLTNLDQSLSHSKKWRRIYEPNIK